MRAIEGGVGAFQRIRRERARHEGGVEHGLRREEAREGERGRDLCAV
jgi:hypothetical protein